MSARRTESTKSVPLPNPYSGSVALEAKAQLEQQLMVARFETLDGPIGWRCRSCAASVLADETLSTEAAIKRLGEAAADHAIYCGRCDD